MIAWTHEATRGEPRCGPLVFFSAIAYHSPASIVRRAPALHSPFAVPWSSGSLRPPLSFNLATGSGDQGINTED